MKNKKSTKQEEKYKSTGTFLSTKKNNMGLSSEIYSMDVNK